MQLFKYDILRKTLTFINYPLPTKIKPPYIRMYRFTDSYEGMLKTLKYMYLKVNL